jgi:hypothetical protein
MFSVTEERLVLANQPQKLLSAYQVPAAKVADMIREATEQIKQLDKELLGEERPLSPSRLCFAARRHQYKHKVYVVRITFRFVKANQVKNNYAVAVSSAEVMKEKDYQPTPSKGYL